MDTNVNLSSGVRMEPAECPTALLEGLSNSDHDPQKSDAPVRKSHINKAPICLKSKYQRMCRHRESSENVPGEHNSNEEHDSKKSDVPLKKSYIDNSPVESQHDVLDVPDIELVNPSSWLLLFFGY